ncbi:MAG: hypothetical protein IJW93_04815 [Clostridia bacterium]|nr:hypothetical protein [Clostridia bacterium]
MTAVYCVIFAISLIIPVGYFLIAKNRRDIWLFLLDIGICVVNLGYLILSASKTVELALFANKLAYFGQVVVIMSMFLIIARLCGIKRTKALYAILISIGAVIYSLVLTTGHLDWYYKSVSIEFVDGATRLVKEYGRLHPLYLVYVLGYFVAMLTVIFYSLAKNRVGSHKLAGLMLSVVLCNIGMWIVEKLVPLNFEFLSVSYLMSGLILFIIHWMLQDYVHVDQVPTPTEERQRVILVSSADRADRVEQIISKLPEGTSLSPRQLDILEGILDGKTRKEIAFDLHLSENTVKMHTSALYKAIGVSHRDEIYAMLGSDKSD